MKNRQLGFVMIPVRRPLGAEGGLPICGHDVVTFVHSSVAVSRGHLLKRCSWLTRCFARYPYMPSQTEPQKLRLSEKVGYGFGDVASCLFWQTFSVYLANFYTDVFGITAAAAATMFLVTRTWDMAFDPVMGVIADRTKSRMGKFRPYLLWVPIPLGIVAVLTFTTPDLSMSGKLVYAYVTYGMLMLLYSVVNVPYAALLGVMTSRPEERTALSSYRMMGAFVGVLLVTYSNYGLVYYFSVEGSKIGDALRMAVTALTKVFDTAGTAAQSPAAFPLSVATPEGYRSAIVVYAVFAVIFFFATFWLTKERVVPISGKNASWKQDVVDLLGNWPWWILVATTILINSFAGVRGGMIVYYFKYYVHNEALSAMYLMLGALASILGIYLVQFVPARFGKKMPFIFSIVLAGAVSVLSYWVEPKDFTALFAYQIVINFFMGPPTAMLWSLYADAADYSEFKTGRRATGLIFSASGMSQKLGWTIASSLGLYLLGFYSFQPNVEQTPDTLNGIRLLVSMIPALCCFGAALLMSLYPLNRRKLQEVEQRLQALRDKEAQPTAS
jgi:GPH family glycoside/pentoside/hexuronide:cation symporter